MIHPNLHATPNVLKQHFEKPGGRPLDRLVRQAKERIGNHRAEITRAVDEMIRQLGQLSRQTGPAEGEKARTELRNTASELASIAALSGQSHVGEVARCLFALCQDMQQSGVWNRAFVDLHVVTLKKAANETDRAQLDEMKTVIDALTDLRARLYDR